ncbi:hypothetical protein BDP55DRAFT_48501 [Colletotrichum godetiae]|uniref:Uncharacterized protein n=1 Tax=Colletotrichum godetiae TaxID=1209918 RepID=A0AAJ0ARZ1_9PEZI|nr:uncharacterized protein BDP55DRAFT_48501 [Colletotrichum godetiae]KAK1688562.1 hypothetical protein BDP55DRAFT_48501 [Colletotrichum godetiae]
MLHSNHSRHPTLPRSALHFRMLMIFRHVNLDRLSSPSIHPSPTTLTIDPPTHHLALPQKSLHCSKPSSQATTKGNTCRQSTSPCATTYSSGIPTGSLPPRRTCQRCLRGPPLTVGCSVTPYYRPSNASPHIRIACLLCFFFSLVIWTTLDSNLKVRLRAA